MQAEHHFGKSEAGIVDRDAMVAGERDLEPAAEAIAVHDGHRRHRQVIEPVDDRVRLGEGRLDRGGIAHAAELADVGAGDEAARLGRAQHDALGQIPFEACEHVVELGEHVFR